MRDRGNPEAFVAKIAENFDNFVKGCYEDNGAERNVVMQKGQYLSDIIKQIEDEDFNEQNRVLN